MKFQKGFLRCSALIIIVLVVIVVSGAAYYFGYQNMFLRVPIYQDQTNTQPASRVTTQAPSNITPQSKLATQPAAESKFEDFLSSFGTLKLTFTKVSSISGQFGDIYSLYARQIAAAKKDIPSDNVTSIDVASTDLNNDGQMEIVVDDNLASSCGSGGCSHDIYQMQNGTWKQIYAGLDYDIRPLSDQTLGYHDLLAIEEGTPGYVENLVRYKWNGTIYKRDKIVAVWDASKSAPQGYILK